ncbi:MAG TPA: hypothetical protein VJB34_03535 [Bdellovibrionota bacterium]|nr:hypothetical protein [Bdellovibrionota bacterium]
MVRSKKALQEFEDNLNRKGERLSYKQAMTLFVAMWLEARRMGVLPLKNPLEGIEVDIEVARILNSCLKKSSHK